MLCKQEFFIMSVIMLKWFIKKLARRVDWIHLAQDGDQWQTLADTILDHQVPLNVGNFFIT